MRIEVRTGLLAIVIGLWSAIAGLAGEWPQIHGPFRNGTATEERLLESWPAGGPRVHWKVEAGSGFSGVAVTKQGVFLFQRRGNEELLECRDASTGQVRWTARFPATYQPTITENDGPLCVPTVTDSLVITFGANGTLSATDVTSGTVRWSRKLADEYGAPLGYFGAGSSPLVIGERILVNLGGDRRGAGILAVELQSGKRVWQQGNELASYSSPIVATIQGRSTAIVVSRLNVQGVNPDNGELLWRFPFGKRGPTVNAALPIVLEDRLFVTASYGIGGSLFQLGEKPELLWNDDTLLSSQYTTPVRVEKLVYGVHGRQDQGTASLRCVDLQARKILWAEELVIGQLLLADGKLLYLQDDGKLLLIQPNPQKFQRLATATVSESITRSLPALSNGRLYVRDSSNLHCLQVGRE